MQGMDPSQMMDMMQGMMGMQMEMLACMQMMEEKGVGKGFKGGKGGRKGKGGGGGGGGGNNQKKPTGGQSENDLHNAVQKILGGAPGADSVKKSDIVYTNSEVEDGGQIMHQSEIKITKLPYPMNENSFTGHPKPTQSEAMASAAAVALESILEDPTCKELHEKKKERKRKEPELDENGEPVKKKQKTERVPGEEKPKGPEQTAKSFLHNAVMKIIAKPDETKICNLKKEHIVYKITEVDGGQKRAEVTVSCLPNSMANASFTGEPCSKEKDAINSAAEIALENILKNDELKALHDRPKKPKPEKEPKE
eukprot:gnl/MRDRNA2_/MRDRNA2_98110_c0_seq1.p1 gnl/MRDRNA2_/MRDRNA2_98110_c0~~gnl/MRDRNA2_/MRDRNA2_98110_c0_seq1.p1  ORF type:complete len:309 (+),score=96.42 gnl/MRDRNA2_/MRDRNA2_98110_c0_seq1:75-1001(+)